MLHLLHSALVLGLPLSTVAGRPLAAGLEAAKNDGGGFVGFGGGSLCCLLVPLVAIALMMSAARRRTRVVQVGGPSPFEEAPYDRAPYEPEDATYEPEPPLPPRAERRTAASDQLEQQVAAALVDIDDAVRSSAEELAFVEEQFGGQATRPFRLALDEARSQVTHAFRLRRAVEEDDAAGLLDDAERRERLDEILATVGQADRTLDAQEAEFLRLRGLEADVPQFLVELRSRVAMTQRRVPAAEQELIALAGQHSADTLGTVRGNVEQARSLLSAAEQSLTTGQDHVAAGDGAAAVTAARAAEDAIGQADTLLSAVGRARDDLASAGARIDEALTSISADIADADRLGAGDAVTTAALTEARAAVASATAERTGGDPLAALRRLVRAERDLDSALDRYREVEDRTVRRRRLIDARISQVGARLEDINAYLQSHRGAVGPDARTHLAEADRIYRDALAAADADPSRATALLDAAEDEAERALATTRDDVDSWGGPDDYVTGGLIGFGAPLLLGGILGGVVIGGAGGGRGGGWGGSAGGFGNGFGGGGRL